jgi:RNA polymerase sigma-70 factor (ECF subfamily)
VPPVAQQQILRTIGDTRIRQIVAGYATALEQGDAAALVALLTEDVTWSMPPFPHWYTGLTAVTEFATRVPLSSCGSWRHVPTTANGQPAVACYLRDVTGGVHRAWSINVLTLRDDRIAEITSFVDREHFAPFGLPDALDINGTAAVVRHANVRRDR